MISNRDLAAKGIELVEQTSSPLGVNLVSTAQVHKNYDPMDLVSIAQQIQTADEFVRANAVNKLTVIADQIRYLQEQARNVLMEARRDNDLHHAACNFRKVPGKIYYLYRRSSEQREQRYFSMLGPSDWGPDCPHEFLGAYKLQHDMSWTPEEKIKQKDDDLSVLNKIYNAHYSITDTPEPNIRGLVKEHSQSSESAESNNIVGEKSSASSL